MSIDATPEPTPAQTPSAGIKDRIREATDAAARKTRRVRDQAEIKLHDTRRAAKDRAALTASLGNAQVERLQNLITYEAGRRPLKSAALLLGGGLALGAVLGLALRRPAGR